MVRDLDPYAKRRVQAILRRCGRGQGTDLRILSDGEDGLRGVVGTWFGKKCEHRLDWFHVARRIARIEKEFLYLPYGDDFQERLAAHWANLNSMKWMLWNDGVDMAEFGMTRVRIGLFQHALAHPEANGDLKVSKQNFASKHCMATTVNRSPGSFRSRPTFRSRKRSEINGARP